MNRQHVTGGVVSLAVVGLMVLGGIAEAHLQYGIETPAASTPSTTALAASTSPTTAPKP